MLLRRKILIWFLAIVVLFFGILGGGIWLSFKGGLPEKVEIFTDKTEYQLGGSLRLKIKNNSKDTLCFSSCYPYLLEKKTERGWESYNYVDCPKKDLNEKCIKPGKVKAFELVLIDGKRGLHRIRIPACVSCKEGEEFKENKRFYSNQFLIKI